MVRAANDTSQAAKTMESLGNAVAVLEERQKKGARAATILSAELRAGANATAAQRKEIAALTGRLYDLNQSEQKASIGANILKTGMTAIASAIAISRIVDYGKKFLEVADAMTQLQARIARLSTDAASARETFNSLADISSKTGTSLNDTTKLWESLTSSLKDAGATNAQVLNLTSTLQKIGRIGGSSTDEIANALRQFGQSIASGTIRAEEFNSILEQMPELARQIASGLGISMGQLRQEMLAGKLTAQDALNAIQDRTGAVNTEFNKLPRSLGQATGALETSFAKLIKSLNDATGASTLTVAAIDATTKSVEALASQSTTTAEKLAAVADVLGWISPLAGEAADSFNRINNANVDTLKGKVQSLTTDLNAVTKSTDKASEATKHFTIAAAQSSKLTGKTGSNSAAKNANDAANALSRQGDSLARLSTGYAEGSLELAKYDAVLALGNKASSEQILKAEQQAESIWKIQKATKAAADEEAKRKQANQNFSNLKGQASPVANIDNSFQLQMEQLNQYATLYPQKIEEVEAVRAAIEGRYREQRQAAMWDEWAQQNVATQLFADTLQTSMNTVSSSLTGLLNGTQSVNEALGNIANTVLSSVVQSFTQMGVEWVKSAIMGQTAQIAATAATTAASVAGTATTTAASTTAAATTTAAWTPAAIVASIGSFGGAAAIGIGAVVAAMALSGSIAGKRKSGGPVSAGSVYQVGEGGMPEIYQARDGSQYMIPGDNGKVISNKDMQGSGGGGVVVNINNYTSSAVDAQATSDGNGGWTVDAFVYDISNGGPASQAIQQYHQAPRKARG
jgi:tape measure domain-containing protein